MSEIKFFSWQIETEKLLAQLVETEMEIQTVSWNLKTIYVF